ncbi:transcriptional regulator with XRE-family HTH domain [Saccharopolyspora lacisalsi]|uniref:Transcriptional regulator with XRE-family HTH domain n=1 Tax=Halosaccharopolyspora lacisalsi TaxID=1000566 RepID=A0A839DSB8_9PSEU|nr:helix-turn-helix domain-containing protein [Halosaccharopolyspora lacisalsi]MBA8823973.1 transcriptional regulator with XRE-family HTH domain [Halosaccharopolyspora lacisalsi]
MPSDNVERVNITALAWDIAADIYFPPDFDRDRTYATVISAHPTGSCKEQTAGNVYAAELARQGFVAIAFDASFQGESGGQPRFTEDLAFRVQDFSHVIDYLVTQPHVDADRKARRAELSPHHEGLPDTGSQRRVPGLRREEVAQLAAISTDYYTRLEQGRIPASAPVLDALARVPHLDDAQREYLSELAGKDATRPRRRTRQVLRSSLQRVLDDLRFTPAFVLGRRMDVLAWNPLAAALVTDFAQLPTKHRNYVRLLFTEQHMRALYADWESVAHTSVALLRRQAAHHPDDHRLTELVGELSVRDTDFRQWWAEHHVANQRIGTKTLHHPVVGELTLD